jgi:hypothetical protein
MKKTEEILSQHEIISIERLRHKGIYFSEIATRVNKDVVANYIYDKIIGMTPKIDDSTLLKRYATGVKYTKFTSNVNFEQLVWHFCKPDKDLSNKVMDIAKQKMNNEA